MSSETATTEVTEVSRAIEVDASIVHSFHVFTVQIGSWWDKDHHLLEAPLAEMVFEPFVGGNIIDRGTDGSEIEIIFTELSPTRTHVQLTHRHLDRHGEGWEGMRDAVSSGWDLREFAAVAARSAH